MGKPRYDLVGKRFGKLVVVGRTDCAWKCICDCGKETEVATSHLTSGKTKSCGCGRRGHDPKRLKDIKGQRFGRLVAIEHIGYVRQGQAIWRFQCDCGKIYEAVSAPVVKGTVVSCGCYNRERMAERNMRHGFAHRDHKEKLYEIWSSMKARCQRKTDLNYRHYGGRGITVCDEWQDYAPFRAWAMANGYQQGLTLDRIDNNSGYSPENCRWVTMLEQMRNTRRNRFIEYDGERKTISAWAADAGIKYGTLWGRLKRGMKMEEALKQPIKGGVE